MLKDTSNLTACILLLEDETDLYHLFEWYDVLKEQGFYPNVVMLGSSLDDSIALDMHRTIQPALFKSRKLLMKSA